MPRHVSSLPQKALDRLVQLRDCDTPYKEIAAVLSYEFGRNLTRNAISGLVWRMDLPPRPPHTKKIRRRKRNPKPQILQVVPPLAPAVVEVPVVVNLQVVPPPAPAVVEVPVGVKRKPAGTYSIFDLMPSNCRYPIGNGPFTFCGAEALWPSSYCEKHTRLCFIRGSARHSPTAPV